MILFLLVLESTISIESKLGGVTNARRLNKYSLSVLKNILTSIYDVDAPIFSNFANISSQ